MNLTCVTLTGADDAVEPSTLFQLATAYPFVEFGILMSKSRHGEPRYPSLEWLRNLIQLHGSCPTARFSLHLCGQYARQVCAGSWGSVPDFLFFWAGRFQLNVAGMKFDAERLASGMRGMLDSQFIIQLRDDGDYGRILPALWKCGINAAPLFDCSGGAGIAPATWPPVANCRGGCGYAGGLTPDNLKTELDRIEAEGTRGSNCPIWIDVESGIRTDDRFDMEKALRFLDIARGRFKEVTP